MPIKFIGKTNDFIGKTLWEIVGNLKDYGIGRTIVRSTFERYPEPCYMKIMKVETLPNPEINTPNDVRKVKVWVQNTFRGRTLPDLVALEGISYKTDYRLIPKDEVAEYCKMDKKVRPMRILPKTMPFPPLLRELVIKDLREKGQEVEDPQLPIVYNVSPDSYYRVAEDGEKPTVEIPGGLGKPASPDLYKDLGI